VRKLASIVSRVARIGCALALLAAARPASAGPVPPKPGRYVTDLAGVLPPATLDALDGQLEAFERETSNQILVWIAPHVPEGTTPEELGTDAIRSWGVGQSGKDNGIVFFVFTQDRKTRIATGYGLEGAVPDARAKRIQAEITRPHFARGDFATGVQLGVTALMAAARGEGFVGTGRTVADWGVPGVPCVRWLLVAGLLATLLVARLRKARTGFLVAIGVWGALVNLAGYFAVAVPSWPMLIFFLVPVGGLAFGLAFTSWLERRWGYSSWKGSSSGSSSTSSGWSSSSSSSFGGSSSGSDSSGFSGGGGDSGGGGASDSF